MLTGFCVSQSRCMGQREQPLGNRPGARAFEWQAFEAALDMSRAALEAKQRAYEVLLAARWLPVSQAA